MHLGRRKWQWAGVCALALCATGCATTIHGTIPAPLPATPGTSFRAGAGRADLTPIPGIPMAGYSMGGKIARGTWQRLQARALYLEDDQGDALVLVACDLDMIPNGLADRVAELLRTTTAVTHLGRAQILLGASHTHHGPAAFLSDAMYNSFAAPRSGFDKELFEFLADGIVKAIVNAVADSTAAVLRTAPAPGSAGAPNDRLPCVFRNRSLAAFERNPATVVAALRAANPAPPCPERCADPLECESVHTRIDYFTVTDAVTSTVKGVAVFLAAHATVLSPDNELYSPDFFGVTSTLLETGQAGCLGGPSAPIVAVFNGAEGDVSPAWEPDGRDRRNVLEIAGEVAGHVCNLLPAAVVRPDPDIAFEWRKVTPLTDRVVDDPSEFRPNWTQRTARQPRVGLPTLGGAEDGRTILHEMGFVEGVRGPLRDDHGIKQPFELEILGTRTSVAGIAATTAPPPKEAPIGVYRLANLALVTLPGEFTTMIGERIRNQVLGELTPAPDRVVLLGLTGGHVSYVTTAEEYEAQHYEGAQNVYGAATGPLLAREVGDLTQELAVPGNVPADPDFTYDPGTRVRWRARDAAGPPYQVTDGLDAVVQDLVTGNPISTFPTFCFRDAVPRLKEIGAGACQRSIPDVFIETDVGTAVTINGVPQGSHPGLDVVTVLTAVGTDATTSKDATEWCAIWMTPAATPAGQYRFRIAPIVGPDFTSALFEVGGPDPPLIPFNLKPLVADRYDSLFCREAFTFLGLCQEPQTCEAP